MSHDSSARKTACLVGNGCPVSAVFSLETTATPTEEEKKNRWRCQLGCPVGRPCFPVPSRVAASFSSPREIQQTQPAESCGTREPPRSTRRPADLPVGVARPMSTRLVPRRAGDACGCGRERSPPADGRRPRRGEPGSRCSCAATVVLPRIFLFRLVLLCCCFSWRCLVFVAFLGEIATRPPPQEQREPTKPTTLVAALLSTRDTYICMLALAGRWVTAVAVSILHCFFPLSKEMGLLKI